MSGSYARAVRGLALVFLAAVLCAPLSAQAVGRIAGTIIDSSGAVVPGVTVTLVNDATQITRTAVTDTNGYYVATSLPVGTYSVSAKHDGFQPVNKVGNNLVADGRLTVDFSLQVASV